MQIDPTTPNAKQYLEKVSLIQQDQRGVRSSEIGHSSSRNRDRGEQLRQSHSREEYLHPSQSSQSSQSTQSTLPTQPTQPTQLRSSRKRSHSVDDNRRHHHRHHHHHHHH